MTAAVPGELPAEREDSVRYAGFGLRLKAGLVDFLILLPLFFATFWMAGGRELMIAFSILSNVAYFGYSIVGHAIWGQTVGKRVVGIRVVDVTGRRIGWRQAVRRSSVDLVLATVLELAYVWSILQIADAEFGTLSWDQLQERQVAIQPRWVTPIEYAYWAWLASEIVTVLFNRRRRALHDFIAGTVVVREVEIASGIESFELRGWRRILYAADNVLATVALVSSAFCALAAITASAESRSPEQPALIAFAVYSGVLAAAYGFAGRSLRRQGRRIWLLHAIALLLTLLPIIPLFFDAPSAGLEPPRPGSPLA